MRRLLILTILATAAFNTGCCRARWWFRGDHCDPCDGGPVFESCYGGHGGIADGGYAGCTNCGDFGGAYAGVPMGSYEGSAIPGGVVLPPGAVPVGPVGPAPGPGPANNFGPVGG